VTKLTLNLRNFGSFVRQRRHDLELPHYKLSVQVGLSPTALNRYERGQAKRLPPPEVLERLAAALQLDVRELVSAAFTTPDNGVDEVQA
jgi:transcriptional regulator with XRE-family HTH domain